MTYPALILPPALTLTATPGHGDENEPFADHIVTRTARGKVREIARLAIYDDGRIYATRSPHVRSSVDYADWSAVTRAVHAVNGQDDDSGDYYLGVVFSPNPAE